MKKLFLLTLISLGFARCEPEYTVPEIYIAYNWTASLEYYYDDILSSDTWQRSEYYGPITSGWHTYHYKLSFENTERTGTFYLGTPASGKRKYFIGIYNYSFDLTYNDE